MKLTEFFKDGHVPSVIKDATSSAGQRGLEPGKQYDIFIAIRFYELVEAGEIECEGSARDVIAEYFQVSRSTIYRWTKKDRRESMSERYLDLYFENSQHALEVLKVAGARYHFNEKKKKDARRRMKPGI